MHVTKYIFSLLHVVITLCVVLFFLALPYMSDARVVPVSGGSTTLGGYAWSSNIGWISMSGNTHEVTVDSNGWVNGYAWSSSVGWIRFGGLSGFPTGGGTTPDNARFVDNGSGQFMLTGWARACAGASNVATCSGGAHSDAGGWDGWIALSGTGYGITFSSVGANPSSFAWGSEVVGWVDFSDTIVGASLSPMTVAWGQTPGPHIPNQTPMRAYVQFTVNVSGGPATGTVPFTLSVGSLPEVTGTYTYETGLFSQSLRVDDVPAGVPQTALLTIDGTVFTHTFTLPVEPPNITVTPERNLVRQGDTVPVTIRVNPDNYQLTCSVSGGGITETFTTSYSGAEYSQTYTTGPIRNQARITVTCTDLLHPTTPEYTTRGDVMVVPTIQEI